MTSRGEPSDHYDDPVMMGHRPHEQPLRYEHAPHPRRAFSPGFPNEARLTAPADMNTVRGAYASQAFTDSPSGYAVPGHGTGVDAVSDRRISARTNYHAESPGNDPPHALSNRDRELYGPKPFGTDPTPGPRADAAAEASDMDSRYL